MRLRKRDRERLRQRDRERLRQRDRERLRQTDREMRHKQATINTHFDHAVDGFIAVEFCLCVRVPQNFSNFGDAA